VCVCAFVLCVLLCVRVCTVVTVCAFVSQTALDGDDESASFGLITATDGAQVAIYTSKNASFRSMSVLKLIDLPRQARMRPPPPLLLRFYFRNFAAAVFDNEKQHTAFCLRAFFLMRFCVLRNSMPFHLSIIIALCCSAADRLCVSVWSFVCAFRHRAAAPDKTIIRTLRWRCAPPAPPPPAAPPAAPPPAARPPPPPPLHPHLLLAAADSTR
jgi:hypothetical protein